MRVLLALIAVGAASPILAQPGETAAGETLTLRLRDAPLGDVFRALLELTGQGYVVDADVMGRADVELLDRTPTEVERAIEALGLSLSGPGRLRRVTAGGRPPTLQLPGTGAAVDLSPREPVDMRELLRLVLDVTGYEIVAPTGPLGRVLIFANEVPVEDLLSAALAAARLACKREGTRVRVSHPADPDAVLLHLDVGDRHYGHVPYREGERGPMTRSSGLRGVAGKELTFTGLVGRGTTWLAVSPRYFVPAGTTLWDGKLESVGPEGSVILLDTGERLEWRIRPVAPGIRLLPEGAGQAIERATVAMHAREFDDAGRILHAALAKAEEASDAAKLRGALADLHFAWAQTLLARRAVPDAVRHLEAAYEIDRAERPWQAGEDLNEIGFAWAAVGEPERAERPHRQALDLARTADLGKEPPAGGCVRMHPRSSWIEPSALNGLANAERIRGKLTEARDLYERALPLWRAVGDGLGASAALTGLGLVQQALGQPGRALKLQEQALKVPRLEPGPRAAILNNLGSAQHAAGRRNDAKASFDAALADYRLLRDRAGEGAVLNNLGALAESRAENAEACAAYVQALAASREGDDRRGEAVTLARVERLVGRGRAGDAALARCREALKGNKTMKTLWTPQWPPRTWRRRPACSGPMSTSSRPCA